MTQYDGTLDILLEKINELEKQVNILSHQFNTGFIDIYKRSRDTNEDLYRFRTNTEMEIHYIKRANQIVFDRIVDVEENYIKKIVVDFPKEQTVTTPY